MIAHQSTPRQRVTPIEPRRSESPVARRRLGTTIAAYLLATALPWLALAATLRLESRSGQTLFILFVIAAAISSWIGGLGAGLVATLLSAALIRYHMLEPRGSWTVSEADALLLATFLFVAGTVILLNSLLYNASRRADAAARHARELAGQLEERSVELEQTNEHLQASSVEVEVARDEAEAERTRVRRVLDGMPDAVAGFDRAWRYTYLNPAAEAMLRAAGRGPASLIGRDAWQSFPELMSARFRAQAIRCAEEQRVGEYEEFFAPLGKWLELRIVPTANGLIAHARDITARKRTSDLLRVQHRFVAALSEAATASQVADVIVTLGVEASGAAAASLVVVDETVQEFTLLRTTGYPDSLRHGWDHFPVRVGWPLSDALLTRLPVVAASLDELAERYAPLASLLRGSSLEGYVALPLLVADRPLGGLSLSFRAAMEFDADTRAHLLSLAEQCAQALERARLYDAARRARDDAEAANRAKTEFLTTMSHELRTPLNAIAGYTELMEMGLRGAVTPEQLDDLQRIRKSQRYLLALINDVLNFAKIEAGHVQYDIRDVALDATLTGVEAMVAPQLRGKGLVYEYRRVDPSVAVRADSDKLEQVVLNLLSNSVKFTDHGGSVTLDCEVGSELVHIRVHDTGRGIPANRLETIFEPFVQIDKGLTRTAEGAGLGLAISRDLARAMGGDLTADSDGERGSTFSLSLPRAVRVVAAAPQGALEAIGDAGALST